MFTKDEKALGRKVVTECSVGEARWEPSSLIPSCALSAITFCLYFVQRQLADQVLVEMQP